MRPPAIFGSDGCNGKISKNFAEIPQVDNKMKRKSTDPARNNPKSSIVAPSADLWRVLYPHLRGADEPAEFRETLRLSE
ncbi:hypothetical protein J3P71_18605 [Rhizobium leguminosarum]|uniref:hypothetical protein n=1 Tax=Rhizobium leguminosarum TaxID=384 RepID=UPI0014428E63|nr:hypothetical protein [Rhizobium leguminosarum]MBY5838241.1 hypothetical protein [Rhizobium leguminosarum]QSZ06871.1 hypothetical protein J3P71_18605 [Rhizobium leguminosarum]